MTTSQPSTSAATYDTSMMLSREDVERLLHDDSPESRGHILEKVANQYNAKQLTRSEQDIAEHIFRLLMRDLSTRVRQTLSERIKDNDGIPRDIVLHLAQDVEPVAVPVLEASQVLSDADLVSIVEASHDMEKLVAISRRNSVSPRVSDALVETNYTQVLTSLLGNKGAELSSQGLTRIATDFADNSDITQALIDHPNLPVTVVERVISKASAAVAAQLKDKYNLSEQEVGEGSAKVRDEYMLRLIDGDLSDPEIAELVEQMEADGSLTPSVLMTSLCRGQLSFFTISLAALAKLSVTNTRKLLADRGSHGFEGIYRKSGLPDSMIHAVRLVLRAVQDLDGNDAIPGSMLYANRLVERIVETAGDQNIEHLPYFIAIIRRNVQKR